MTSVDREEIRFFLESGRAKEARAKVSELLGHPICYSSSVTETVYFTETRERSYALPTGLRIRIRRYVGAIGQSMHISSDHYFLETKVENGTGANSKSRTEVSGIEAFERLYGRRVDESFPALIPYIGTQSERTHWSFAGGRVTLDTNVRLFAFGSFTKDGVLVEDFNEGKLEIKLEPGIALPISNRSLTEMGCVTKDFNHLERRARSCMKTWSLSAQT